MFWGAYYFTFFGLHMISPNNVEIYVYLTVNHYLQFSIPTFGKNQVLAGNRDKRNHTVVLMQHCEFCFLPVSVCFTVTFRVVPKEMPKWTVPNSTVFEYYISNVC